MAAKRDRPGEDLLSALIAVRDADDGRLSDAELAAMVTTLVAAGYVSAANAITVGTIQLVREGRLADVDEAVVEEVLRRQAGLTGEPMGRWAAADVDLHGVRIEAGDLVLVRLDGANRDPRRFPDPDLFFPGRPDPHIAFGRGPHHCLGAALARTELGAALHTLAERVPDLRLAVPVEDVVWVHGFADAGPAALPVTW